jgi:hypothetical protein
MLSEAVLLHLDEAGEQGTRTIYLRYVDDIKIFAKTEDELRRKLIKLDLSAKEIGLFPQTSKINIRKLIDPEEEIKSVSRPPEAALKPKVNQIKLRTRLLELSRNGKVEPGSATRFKYLLAHAEPDFRLNKRLMRILARQPDFARSICAYIERYKRIPNGLAQDIIAYLTGIELYHSVNGGLLRACLGKLPAAEAAQIGNFCAIRLLRPKRGSIPTQPSYREALIAWCLEMKKLSFSEYDAIVTKERDWWVRKCAIRGLEATLFGSASYTDLINRLLRSNDAEVARIAASRLLQEKFRLTTPYGDVEAAAKRTLKVGGLIRTVGQPKSRINEILGYIIKRAQTSYDWKAFFGTDHRHAELMMIFLKRNRESNIDAFLVQLDSFCDLLTGEIYRRLKPGKHYPNFGHAIKDTTLIGALPIMMTTFLKVHDLRLQSTTAHPKGKKTGLPTRRLRHRDFYTIRPDLIDSFDEFEATSIP